MPVVNTSNFVDRLRELTKRCDPRDVIENTRRRWSEAYSQCSVGSPEHVQEFYRYIKVYPQCPANDILFMNMTAQLTRASIFPTNRMFKQMLKLEMHIDQLLAREGCTGVYAARGIEILSCQNYKFIQKFRKYKRNQEMKNFAKESKQNRKEAKILTVLRDSRLRSKNPEYPPAPAMEFVDRVSEKIVQRFAERAERSMEVQRGDSEVRQLVLATDLPDVPLRTKSMEELSCQPDLEQLKEATAVKLQEIVDTLVAQENVTMQQEDVVVEEGEEEDENDEDEEAEEEDNDDTSSHSNNVTVTCDYVQPVGTEIVKVEEEPIEEDDEVEMEKIEEKDLDDLEYEIV